LENLIVSTQAIIVVSTQTISPKGIRATLWRCSVEIVSVNQVLVEAKLFKNRLPVVFRAHF
jgi:hypothetical protein